MAIALYRLGRWSADHAKSAIALWLVIMIAVGGAAAAWGKPFTDEVSIGDADFIKVIEDLGEDIPAASGGAGVIVIETDGDEFSDKQKEAFAEAVAEWKKIDHIVDVTDPFAIQESMAQQKKDMEEGASKIAAGREQIAAGAEQLKQGQAQLVQLRRQIQAMEQAGVTGAQLEAMKAQEKQVSASLEKASKEAEEGAAKLDQSEADLASGKKIADAASSIKVLSEDGKFALSQVVFDTAAQSVPAENRDAIVEAGKVLKDSGLTVHYSHDITRSMDLVGIGEIIGLIIAGIVLFVMLGTLVAAGLPLIAAVVGVGVGMAGTVAASHFHIINSTTPSLALMLGLAVGIDYTLFIVNRHRIQLRSGMEMRESIGRAVGTAGSAVVFAGLTVIIALSALAFSGINMLTEMGLVAASTVAVTVLVSLILTPACLALIGRRVMSKKAWEKAEEAHSDGESEHGGWLINALTARPWLAILGIVAILGVSAIPAASLRLGLPDGGSEPEGSSGFVTHQLIADNFGEGTNGPIVAVARTTDAKDDVLDFQADVATRLADVEGVKAVAPFGVSDDKTAFAFQVIPETGPSDEATAKTLDRLHDAGKEIGSETSSSIGLAGQTVANIEISDILQGALPTYLAVVVGLSLILLVIVFRSLVVPLVATLGFLLSVGAAFGAVVAVYQWGWLAALFDVGTPGPVMSFAPIMIIGVLFGLAMDYQMFLVTGMREAWAHGEPARKAVKTGFRHGTLVVTAAALIMFSVFGGFVFSHMTMVRPIGLGLAVGVLVDAVVVRQMLTPAIMHLLGEKAWWMPRWLDKILPQADVEGAGLAKHLGAPEGSTTKDEPAASTV